MQFQDPITLIAIEAVVVLVILLLLLGFYSRYQSKRIKRLRSLLEDQQHMPGLDLGELEDGNTGSYRHHLNQAMLQTISKYKELRPEQPNFELHPDLSPEEQTTALRMVFLHAEKNALKSTDEEGFWQSIHKSLSRVMEAYGQAAKSGKSSDKAEFNAEDASRVSGQPAQEAELLGHLFPAIVRLLKQAQGDSQNLSMLTTELKNTIKNENSLANILADTTSVYGPIFPTTHPKAANTLEEWQGILEPLKQAQQACQKALSQGQEAPVNELAQLQLQLPDFMVRTKASMPIMQQHLKEVNEAIESLQSALNNLRPRTEHHAFLEEMIKEFRDYRHNMQQDLNKLASYFNTLDTALQQFSLLQD
ncbi:hypothetical protein [Balneatrix alpica]|uniref:hypothetical protein n=1 Tax=Balneatrix alpica TaxID=75684 RepID=UPI002738C5ED|nr:hypothetical protein [Balneatrix alpica]